MTYDYKLYLVNKIIIDVAFPASLVCKRERFEKITILHLYDMYLSITLLYYKLIYFSILILVIVSLYVVFHMCKIIYRDKMHNEIKLVSEFTVKQYLCC